MDSYNHVLKIIQADLDAGKIDQEQAAFLRRWLDGVIDESYKKLRQRYRPEDFIDPTGTTLNPSWHGEDCLGNGEHPGIECCCDECQFYLSCFPDWKEQG